MCSLYDSNILKEDLERLLNEHIYIMPRDPKNIDSIELVHITRLRRTAGKGPQ